ncbi:hypothetical protein [Streptomyces griseoaurantiacus]|uniref:hypothetical protein n=1 Tax=Streptomyces griseoaurantiacus TaxID=68213 RepID=UPI0017877BC4|nr:hypothetical protein GCM10018782_54280 [Streptomyces griseoaurantiacus]
MNRKYLLLAGTAALTLTCAGCGDDAPAHGADALKDACGGVLDRATIKESSGDDKFDRLRDTSKSESHESAAKILLEEDHAAYVCEISIDDAPAGGDRGLSINYIPDGGHLFPENEKRSFSGYKAYALGGGMQATTESGSASVYFPCKVQDREDPVAVTGEIDNDLDLSVDTQFRVLFRSSNRMVELLKCTNAIDFPAPETMKPFPMIKD